MCSLEMTHSFNWEKFLGQRYASCRKVILVDSNTKVHCLPLIKERVLALEDAEVVEIDAGESSKTLSSCEHIWQSLSVLLADRKTLLINLGGGMVCDVGGFAASVFLRGIDFIHIPTTLLSMVDSAVGGKTGINFAGKKNQVGTFTRPSAVFISPVWLRTLPGREMKSGFAEILKHALISGRENWEDLARLTSLDGPDWLTVIRDSVMLKNRIVNADFRDRNQRKTLNFGHTIGHALESYSLKAHADPLKHGEAIVLGMLGEIFLSEQLLQFPSESAAAIYTFLSNHFHELRAEFDKSEVLELMRCDKKNAGAKIQMVLLKDTGHPVINQQPDEDQILRALDFILERAGKPALQS
jgi:3-dehydroquinate synthase